MESIQDILQRSKYKIPNQAELETKMQQLLANQTVKEFVQKNNLTHDFLRYNLPILQEFVTEDNFYQQTGSAKAVPGYKPILELAYNTLKVSYVKTKEQQVQDQLRHAQTTTAFINIPKSIRQASLQELDITPDNQYIIQKMMAFIKQTTQQPHDFVKGFYLWGDFGRGKTYLMGALVNKLAERGVQSTMINVATFIADLKSHFQDGDYVQKQIAMLQTVPFLVLDDIGAESLSDWARDDVLGVILQYRMQEELATCFTSNLSLAELAEHLAETKTANNQIKAGRIMERIYFLADDYKLEGENRRH